MFVLVLFALIVFVSHAFNNNHNTDYVSHANYDVTPCLMFVIVHL